MKYLMILALLPLTALARADGNDGPHGAPMPPMPAPPPRAATVAEVVVNCGFMCPNRDVRSVIIDVNGGVSFEQTYQGSPMPPVLIKLAQLEPRVIAKIKEKAAGTKGADLVDLTPRTPECMDAPTTTFLVYQGANAVKIEQDYGCHRHVLPDQSGDDLVRILTGLQALPLE
jgi:hypothetical protein